MNIEEQVTNLELSEKLKELGVRRDSYFGYYESVISGIVEVGPRKWMYTSSHRKLVSPAYTVAELGEMLPNNLKGGGGTYYHFESLNNFGEWIVWYRTDYGDSFKSHSDNSESEADARAQLLIWLIENNHLTIEELNK